MKQSERLDKRREKDFNGVVQSEFASCANLSASGCTADTEPSSALSNGRPAEGGFFLP